MDNPPIVVTRETAVADDVARVAAAAGTTLRRHEAVDAAGVAADWRRAPLVVLDVTAAKDAAAVMPRREATVVVATGELDAEQWSACVAVGARQVLTLGRDDTDLLAAFVDSVESARATGILADEKQRGRIVAVVGAVGGAGATVLSVASALAAARGGRGGRGIVAIDTDDCGAGLEIVAGVEAVRGARWGDISAPGGRLAADALLGALPAVPGGDGAAVLSFGRGGGPGGAGRVDPALVGTVLDAIVRAGGVAVVDVARCLSAVADHVVGRADLTVVISPADVRGCYGAARIAAWLDGLGARAGLVVRGPSPGGLGADDIAAAVQLPLIATMRPEPGLERRVDIGGVPGRHPRSPLGRAAAAVLRAAGGA